jgi:hypothetical protein
MKSNYQILPFYKDIKETSLFNNQGLNVSLSRSFKVFTEYNRLIPFVCEVNSDCNFELIIKDFNGELCGIINKSQFKHKVYTSNWKSYLVYNGDEIGCLELGECNLPYTINIGNYYSEWFWVGSDVSKLLKIEIGNEIDLSKIPYSKGFRQVFYLESNLGMPEVDSFSISNRDSKGTVTTTYQKLTETFNLFFNNVPFHVKQVFQSFEVLDFVNLSYGNESVICDEKQAKIKSKRNENGFYFYDVEVSIPNKEVEEIKVCEESKFVSTSCEVLTPSIENCIIINPIKDVVFDCEIDNIESVKLIDCDADNDILETKIDCTPDNEIDLVLIDCNEKCTEIDLVFYATVTY